MKIRFFLLVFVTLFCMLGAFAQEVQWKKNFGGSDADYYSAVTTVSDGIVAVGYSKPDSFGNGDWEDVIGKGNYDAIIVKYDNIGNIVWKKNFGGSDRDYYSAISTVSDGIVAVGRANKNSFDNGDWESVYGRGGNDAIIVKYNFNGDVVWRKNFGGSAEDLYCAVTSVSDGIVAVGFSDANSFGNGDWTEVTKKGGRDAIIVKYDNDGNVVWKKNFGGSNADIFNAVTTISDGIVVAGVSGSLGTGDWAETINKGGGDAIIVKYDNDGNVMWKKNFGGSADDEYHAVTTASDGVVAVGYSQYGSFGNGDWEGIVGRCDENIAHCSDAIIVKYDNSGNIVWKKNFGGSDRDYYNAVTTVSDGIVAVGHSPFGSFDNGDWEGVPGKSGSNAIIVKYDNSGNILWKKNFGCFSDYSAIISVSDGVVAVGGTSIFGYGDWAGVTGRGGGDAIIVKYSDNSASIANTEKDNNIIIYPNPTNDIIYFDKEFNVKIYNIQGTLLKETFGKEIDLSTYPQGMYFLQIENKIFKIVKN